MKNKLFFLLTFLPFILMAQTEWYASPIGTSSNTGLTSDSPWDLQTALTAGNGVQPGDTIWLLEGENGETYNGRFTSTISGTASNPITVSSLPGEWAVLNGNVTSSLTNVLTVTGGYVHFKDFEITHIGSFSRKKGEADFSICSGISHIDGENCKFLNLVVHDNPGSGIASWKRTAGSEIYGCVIYNNGWVEPSGRLLHGVGIYVQNSSDQTRLLENNIIFNQFYKGIEIWSACGAGGTPSSDGTDSDPCGDFVKNIDAIKNTVFNSGDVAAGDAHKDNIIVATDDSSGVAIANNINIFNNVTYHNTDFTAVGGLFDSPSLTIGFNLNAPVDKVTVKDNIIMGRNNALRFFSADDLTYEDNLSWGRYNVIQNELIVNGAVSNWTFNNNTYFTRYNTEPCHEGTFRRTDFIPVNGTVPANPSNPCINPDRSFAKWQSDTGLDGSSTWGKAEKAPVYAVNNFVEITPNTYDPKKFKVVTLNIGQTSITADFSGFSEAIVGESYRLIDVENYNTPIEGILTASKQITIQTGLTAFSAPLGSDFTDGSNKTIANFGVFIVEFVPVTPEEDVVVQLQKCYGDIASYDGAHNTIQHPDGGYLIYGTTAGSSADNTFDFYLVKTDAQGNEEWSKTFDTDDNSIIDTYTGTPHALPGVPRNNQLSVYAYGDQMLLTKDNHIIISGSSTYAGSETDKRSLPYVAKLDLAGNVVWQKLYHGSIATKGVESITELNDGFLLSGVSTNGGNSAFWIKIDDNGGFVWEKIIDTIDVGGNGLALATMSLELSSGNIGAITYDLGPSIRTFILELNASTGDIISKKKLSDDGHELWVHGFEKVDGGFILIGANSTTQNKTVVSKIDNNLNLVWTKTYNDVPELSNSRGYDGVELPDGTYSIVGYRGSDTLYLLNVNSNDGSVNYIETFEDQYDIGYSIDLASDGGMLISYTYYAGGGSGLPTKDMCFIKTKGVENVTSLSGKAYFDINENCTFDNGDNVLANALIYAETNSGEIYQTVTDNEGNYNFILEAGAYTLTIDGNLDFNQTVSVRSACSNSEINVNLRTGQIRNGVNFALMALPPPPVNAACKISLVDTYSPNTADGCPLQDGSIGIYTTPCPDQAWTYCVSYENTQNTPISSGTNFGIILPNFIDNSITITSVDDSSFTFIENQVSATDQADLNITTGEDIPVGGSLSYCITLTIGSSNNGPYQVQFIGFDEFGFPCEDVPSDSIVDNCSCDPNDMQVSPKGCGEFGNVNKDEKLTYTIRFENIGPGRAKSVNITNPLDIDLDLSSIKLVNASHKVTNFQVEPNNDLLIRFEDIFLNPIQDAPLNRGFITFSISPKSGLADGTVITNQASIVFDSNEPFVTNEVINTLYDDPSVSSDFSFEKQCDSYGFDYDFTYAGDTSNANFLWNFGADATPQTSTDANPTDIAFTVGDYDVMLTVTKNGCSDSSSQTLSVSDVGTTDKGKVFVCHNGETKNIKQKHLAKHLAHGDCIGACDDGEDNENEEEVEVCHKGKAKTVNIKSLKAHLNHGDQLGACISSRIGSSDELIDSNNELLLYPNPTSNMLNLNINSIQDYNTLKVVDISGRVMLVKSLTKNSISLDVSNLSKGMYFVTVQSNDKHVLTKKFIKM